jgi:hypothetical protein
VLNNFGADSLHVKLVQRVFQNMFPSINVAEVSCSETEKTRREIEKTGVTGVLRCLLNLALQVNISGIKRVVMFNLNDETGEIGASQFTCAACPVEPLLSLLCLSPTASVSVC